MFFEVVKKPIHTKISICDPESQEKENAIAKKNPESRRSRCTIESGIPR